MKLFNKLKKFVTRSPKVAVIAVATTLIALVAVPLAVAEFYPDRQPFDYNKPCNPNDSDKYDRCGSLTGPVFNSFINTPSYGDERAFLDARRTDQTAAGSYQNVLNNVTDGSKEVILRTYIHNNANQSTNASGLGVAKNTTVRVALPTGTAQALRARSYISASNATPRMVEDTVDLVSNKKFRVEYIPGSAILYNNSAFKEGKRLPNSVVTSGTLIGDDALDGNLPGCFEYEAVVHVRVKIIVEEEAPKPELDISKKVRVKGTSDWKETVDAKPGDTVEWLIDVDTKGAGVNRNIITRDVLPPHVTLVPGTVRWIDAQQNAVQNDKPLFDGGINVGNYGANSGFYMMFATKVGGDFEECQIRIRNVAYARSDQNPEENDTADVIITRDNCEPPQPEPEYSCDALKTTRLSNRRYQFTTDYTARNGAEFVSYSYDFGDGTEVLVTDQEVVEHTFPERGTFPTRVSVNFNVNGQQQTVTSNDCVVVIKTDLQEYCPIPGKEHLPKDSPECKENPDNCPISGKEHLPKDSPECVTELPKTGVGGVAGIFAAVSVAGTTAYQVVVRRKR